MNRQQKSLKKAMYILEVIQFEVEENAMRKYYSTQLIIWLNRAKVQVHAKYSNAQYFRYKFGNS